MRPRTASMIAAIAISTIGLAALASAQDRDRGRDQTAEQDRDRVSDRTGDRDRLAERDRALDRDFDRDRDRVQDVDRVQDRDRDQLRDPLHVQDRDQLRDRDIYGSELMTRQERREYRDRVQNVAGVPEWAQFRAEHQQRMLARAEERGVELPPPFYGQQLMTDQERERLRERLQNAESEEERARIREEHREQMQERAREHQIPLSELG